MLDQSWYLLIVGFRFAKKLSKERTFTICGNADYLAPEIVQGKGHCLAADWWALGVLIYCMLQGEMPFGPWRQNELDTFQKIAKGQLTFPPDLGSEAKDLITQSWSNISGERHDVVPKNLVNGDDGMEDEDEDSESHEENEDGASSVPNIQILQVRRVAHHGCVNRIRAIPQNPHICVSWADSGYLWNMTSHLNALADSETQGKDGTSPANWLIRCFSSAS
ncbi:protein phosphatase 2C and cyclic nucleotide-binding/kinase domain-containing protein-like [Raphanus sativus]|uniref:Uncharacterized protein LOC108852913 isoform X2 n=1 Tax=Raphanus sativus TaxID=3726 RepID=A0A9W3DL99_RAPSA|nr:uncharacterized protein LOC108852913 isoform X2 [Raphanus sativus]KAJ4902770.1 protein phosphatase 2C and cyclic nucleotide-binding/kinase domain-containing protein-like [Raphanus sativus]